MRFDGGPLASRLRPSTPRPTRSTLTRATPQHSPQPSPTLDHCGSSYLPLLRALLLRSTLLAPVFGPGAPFFPTYPSIPSACCALDGARREQQGQGQTELKALSHSSQQKHDASAQCPHLGRAFLVRLVVVLPQALEHLPAEMRRHRGGDSRRRRKQHPNPLGQQASWHARANREDGPQEYRGSLYAVRRRLERTARPEEEPRAP